MTLNNLINSYVENSLEVTRDMNEDIEHIQKFFDERQLEIPEAYGLPFANHIVMLIRRIRENDCIIMDSADEMPQHLIDQAEEMLEPLFIKYGAEKNESEIKLMAIYLALINENRKEIESNE